MTFDDYTRSLDCLVMLGRPEPERIRSAYMTGSGGKKPPRNLMEQTRSTYLWDRIRLAFELGQG
jgi:hypothetical protein